MIPPVISSSIAMMTRRLFRSGLQLGIFTALLFTLLYLVDSRYRVLPQTIHNALPAHHPGLVVVDVTVVTCSFGSCTVPAGWRRIDKDLYLSDYWLSKAYIHVQQKKEEELTAADRVVVDVRTGRKEPLTKQAGKPEAWERRPGGIWLLRSASGRRASDSDKAVTSVDVLFGPDAVEPRPGWEIRDASLSLSHAKDGLEPRLTVRRGAAKAWDKPTVRVGQDGRFKIMQVSDMHLSTGVGACRDPASPSPGGKCEADPRTLDFIERLLDEEKPDMVVLSGDQVNGETAPDAQTVS
jgi:hypothetical protein